VKLDDHTEHLQARIVSAYVCVHGVRFAILNIYSPTDCTESESAKASFYAALTKAKLELDKTPKYKPIILGDWNATISSESKSSGAWDSILGHNNSDRVQTNENGERILAWCSKHRMKIMNTLFRTKRIHRGTWRHPATGIWKRIDYICTSKWVSKFIQSCRVYIGPSALFDTDHRLLVMNMSFPATKQQLKFSVNRSNRNVPAPSTDHRILRISVEHRQKLTDELERELDEVCQIDEVNELNERITTSVISCAEKVCPKTNHIKKKEPWDDDELLNEMKNLSKCKNDKEIRKQQKNIKKRRNKLMNDYYRELANNINTVAEARDTDKEFALACKYSALKKSTRSTISNKKLKTHFADHFSKREISLPPELENSENYPFLTEEPQVINQEIPSSAEVQSVIKTFKTNKSAGTDKLNTEHLKYNNSNKLVSSIVKLLALI